MVGIYYISVFNRNLFSTRSLFSRTQRCHISGQVCVVCMFNVERVFARIKMPSISLVIVYIGRIGAFVSFVSSVCETEVVCVCV